MGLFKSRGKHTRSAESKNEEATAVEEELTAAESDRAPEAAPDGNAISEPENEGDPQEADTLDVHNVGPEHVSEQESAGFTAAFADLSEKKHRRGLKALGITAGVFIGVLCIAYIAGAVVFMGRFLPYTNIAGHDVSLKTDEEVVKLLEDAAAGYRIDVVGDGFSYRMGASDIGLSVDAAGIVAAMHEDLNAWAWPTLIIRQSHDESDRMAISFKRTEYEQDLTAALDAYNTEAAPPVNATIAYDGGADRFVVQPEQAGTQINAQTVLESLAAAISDLQPKLVLTDDDLIQPTVLSTDEKLIESAELATGMVSAKLTLVMGGKTVSEVDSDTLSGFITIGDDLGVTFREEELNAWADGLAASFKTVGTERTYTRADGKQITVSGGVYGWEIDTEALKGAVLEGVRAGSVTQIEVPCSDTAAVYNGPNQRDWGNRYIDVDISEQHVRFYGDDGAIIWESDCITGSPDGSHNTWPGVWYVNAKQSPSKLIGYENGKKIYETPVTYWMPFEGNGIGFHDATWQPSFGGSMYANGYGSHGCVNLSYSSAQSLYDIIRVGDVVVVHS